MALGACGSDGERLLELMARVFRNNAIRRDDERFAIDGQRIGIVGAQTHRRLRGVDRIAARPTIREACART